MKGIKVSEVTKSFGKKPVLENISTFFKPCTIYGLLGRNGVGKSTLIHLISGRIFADKGEITLDGNKILESAPEMERIFAVGQFETYQGGMKLIEIINDTARFYPGFDEKYSVELAEKFGIDLKARYGKLSTGYKTIFKDILALCVPCEYIFFDEPVLGLDASNRNLFYCELVDSYTKRPRTFVISTHLIEEIQNLIENVVIIADHRIILEGAWTGLLGAILPILIVDGLYVWMYGVITASLSGTSYSLLTPGTFLWEIDILLAAIGIIIGALGSGLSMSRFLKI